MNCRENRYIFFCNAQPIIPTHRGCYTVGLWLVQCWLMVGTKLLNLLLWLAVNVGATLFHEQINVGPSKLRLAQPNVAVGPTLNQRVSFVWRVVSMLAGWYPDRITQGHIPQYEKWTKSHSMKGGENKCQQLHRGPQWQYVHIAQHMKSCVVWSEQTSLE